MEPQIFRSEHISVSIDCPADKVYEFASNPENLPKWAAGLSSTITKAGEDWVVDSPLGRIRVMFTEKNPFGIMDHQVTLPSGEKVYSPMRIFSNHLGSEVLFTLYQRPGMSEQMFAEDAEAVAKDLKRLKDLME